MKHYTENFDKQLHCFDPDENNNDIGFFEDTYAPYLLPWIGINYESGEQKRLLLVGESHHIAIDKEDYDSLCSPNQWYFEPHTDINELHGEVLHEACNTRFLIGLNKWDGPAGIYINPRKVIADVLGEEYDRSNSVCYMNSVACCNYFLRPAYKGKSIRQQCDANDKAKAYLGLNFIAKTIGAQYVYFLSKFAYDTFLESGGSSDFIHDFSPHPQWPHWYNYGRDKFKDFLISNSIFNL